MEESPTYTPAAEGELYLASVNDYEVKEFIVVSCGLPSPLVRPSSKSSASPMVPPSSKPVFWPCLHWFP